MPNIETADPAKFTNVYNSTTGQKARIPARWMEHPKLSRGFRKTPLQKVAEQAAEKQADPAPAAGDDTKKGK